MLEGFQHTVGILLGHLDEGEVLHQVDATYLHLLTPDIAVQQPDNLASIHAVNLAHVQEQPDISCLGRTVIATLLVVIGGLALILLSHRRDLLDLGRIGIVTQEAPELAA